MSLETEIEGLKPWQKKMNKIIFGTETYYGRLFDIVLLVVILISIIAVMLESVPSINSVPKYHFLLSLIEWVFTILFSLELIARLLCVKKPLKYIFSFYGIIDVLSILPTYLGIFYTGTGALKVLRCARLLRVFRILKLSQFVDDAKKLSTALKESKNKIIVFLFTVSLLVLVLGTIMYLVEHGEHGFDSIPRSIYWAIVTLTTVGYGDIAPTTALGQFIASLVMILGYAIIAVPTGIVTNELMRSDKPNTTISKRTCHECGQDGHDKNADYCKHCGGKLDQSTA